MEEFKRVFINDIETNYEISNIGRLRNVKTGVFIKPYITWNNYYKFIFRVNGKKVNKFMHRLIMEYFVPNPDNLPQVNHINGIKTDNRIENLEWCSRSHNMQHAFDNGLIKLPIGEKRYNNKYTETSVKHVIELLKTGEYTKKEIADIVDVPKSLVKAVKQKHNWRYLTGGLDLKYRQTSHIDIYNSVDRAIIAGKKRKEIIHTIMEYGLSNEASKSLYRRRKKKVDNGESLVQNTIYIDEGIEIF